MGRKKPSILLQHIDSKTGEIVEVLATDALYIVTFDGAAINIRRHNYFKQIPLRYRATSFPNRGFAIVLRDRLNTLFETDKFNVQIMQLADCLNNA